MPTTFGDLPQKILHDSEKLEYYADVLFPNYFHHNWDIDRKSPDQAGYSSNLFVFYLYLNILISKESVKIFLVTIFVVQGYCFNSSVYITLPVQEREQKLKLILFFYKNVIKII